MAIIDKPSDYFNTKLFTGNGGTNAITGVGFQPDWIWFKNRTSAQSHAIVDSVRGRKGLQSNATDAEYTLASGKDFGTFDSDGFTVLTPQQLNSFNYNTGSIVSWNWKAGTSVSGNTSGSGTAKAYSGSVNTTSGFSIITYLGNGTAGHAIPHHLGTTPALVIARTISVAKDWNVYHHKNTSAPETEVLVLNTTAATADDLGVWNDTAPTSSVVTLGDSSQLNTNDGTCILYAFSEKQGFSKMGSYTGNGNAYGAFIYTGFKPAFVLVKRTDSANDWCLYDNKRDTDNVVQDKLQPNQTSAESDDTSMDFVSNGFKFRETGGNFNASGGTYIYMAFAENPFVASNFNAATAR